ncbi:hypothetical protein JTB14_000242 [Gonioctena quinquepunctata]|nr:hypothetical protein JTB14_000242 [Gonioctena quinquepunctata]
MKCLKINFRASDGWIVCGESAIEIITEDFNIENGIKDAEIIFGDIGRSMTPSLSTTSSLSTLSNHSVIREEASPESDDIQKCIVRGGGQYIIDQYNKNKMLTDRCRIQLVNIVANILFEKFGTAVPKSAKIEYAKKLVEAFPTYRNFESSCGGYEIFFNPLTNGGYLANRLRTLNRIHKVEGTSSKSVHQIKANHSPVRNETTIIPDDMDEKFKDLMTTPSTEKEKIKRLFLETHSFRKYLTSKTSIMEMFPRLRDTSGLVEQEFSLMFPSCSSNFEERYLAVMENILSIYTRTTSSSHPLSVCGFSLNIQSFYALLKMGV